jgi:serine/threonine-protein kinase HipA
MYGLTTGPAREVIHGQIEVINRDWVEVADLATLTAPQRNLLWHRQI